MQRRRACDACAKLSRSHSRSLPHSSLQSPDVAHFIKYDMAIESAPYTRTNRTLFVLSAKSISCEHTKHDTRNKHGTCKQRHNQIRIEKKIVNEREAARRHTKEELGS